MNDNNKNLYNDTNDHDAEHEDFESGADLFLTMEPFLLAADITGKPLPPLQTRTKYDTSDDPNGYNIIED